VDQIYLQSRNYLEDIIRERTGKGVSALLRKGRLEHVIFMQWVACRDIIYRQSVPKGESELLQAYLAQKGFGADLRDDAAIELTLAELRQYTCLVRQWSWSLRQGVTPKRGKVLEKVVRLATQEALREALTLPVCDVSVQDTTGDAKSEHVDSTVIVTRSGSTTKIGLSIKGNIRERKDEAVDTRRKAILRGEVQDVWHIFLSDGDPADVDALNQMNPPDEGIVYSWSGLARKVNKDGIKALSSLPADVMSIAKQHAN
jgi:hypothetical protein